MIFADYWPAIMLALGAWILLFHAFQLDSCDVLGWDLPLAISRILTGLLALTVVLLAGSYMAKAYYSRLVLAFFPPLLGLLLLANRLAYQFLLQQLREYGVGVRKVAIVGQSDLARELGRRIVAHKELNYELAGYIYPTLNRNHFHEPATHLETGGSEEMARALANRNVDELIFTTPLRRDTGVLEFVAHCQKQGLQVKLIPEYYDLHTQQIESRSIDGIPIFELREISLDPSAHFLKATIDYSIAFVLFILFLPLMAAIGALLGVLGTGPIVRRERRVGFHGHPFLMYRFDLSAADTRPSTPAQSRKARFCRFLHRYSLSELPQLWNVLKGDMSIVGPRPETPDRVRHYSEWHMRRLQVKPGITGLAQVRGLRGFDSSDLKTKQDLEYVATFSPILDLTLIVATLGTLVRRRKTKLPTRDTLAPAPTQAGGAPKVVGSSLVAGGAGDH
jgi:lipopolysaccharide/colanic/teichoic acid biosynthesis glycosyltransferase